MHMRKLFGEGAMIRHHYLDIPVVTSFKGAQGLCKQTLIGKEQAAGNFYLRHFSLYPAGCTPRYSHPWEREIYFLSGAGTVLAVEEA